MKTTSIWTTLAASAALSLALPAYALASATR